MLYFYYGNDSQKLHSAAEAFLIKNAKRAIVVKLSDVSTAQEIESAAGGGGLFGEAKCVVLSGIFSSENEELLSVLENLLPSLKESSDMFLILELSVDAATKKLVGKYAEATEGFEVKKAKEYPTVFGLVDALKRRDRKSLWVGYQKELLKGNAPEAIHGTLFWGVKKMFQEARDTQTLVRAKSLLVQLAELPHEARRKGFELEYALERFFLEKAC